MAVEQPKAFDPSPRGTTSEAVEGVPLEGERYVL